MKNKVFSEFADPELYKKGVKRGKELGLQRADTVNAFANFLVNSSEEEIYSFIQKWHIRKPIIVALLLVVFLGVGMYVTHFGERVVQWATSEHLYDTIQGDRPF